MIEIPFSYLWIGIVALSWICSSVVSIVQEDGEIMCLPTILTIVTGIGYAITHCGAR